MIVRLQMFWMVRMLSMLSSGVYVLSLSSVVSVFEFEIMNVSMYRLMIIDIVIDVLIGLCCVGCTCFSAFGIMFLCVSENR